MLAAILLCLAAGSLQGTEESGMHASQLYTASLFTGVSSAYSNEIGLSSASRIGFVLMMMQAG